MSWTPTRSTYASAGGAVFAILWGAGSGASGNPAEAAFQLNRGATVRDCGFWYPGQSATASAPIEYGSTLLAYDPGGDIHQTATGNWCANCYNFIDFRGSMAGVGLASASVAGNIGSPIHVGLAIDYQTDWGTFHDNHWNSGALDESDPLAKRTTCAAGSRQRDRLSISAAPTG